MMRRGTKTLVAKELLSADVAKEYENKLKDVRKLMKLVDSNLTKHAKDQKKNSKDWGYVGDLGKVYGDLAEINRFLG